MHQVRWWCHQGMAAREMGCTTSDGGRGYLGAGLSAKHLAILFDMWYNMSGTEFQV